MKQKQIIPAFIALMLCMPSALQAEGTQQDNAVDKSDWHILYRTPDANGKP